MAETSTGPIEMTVEALRSLYDHAPVMLHSIDAEGRLLSANAVWLKRLGYAAEEVVGRHLGDFLTEAGKIELARTLPIFLREGRITDKAYQMVARDGRVLDVLVSAVGEYDASGRFVRSLAAVQDVTERRRAETALAESEALFRLAFENANEGLSIIATDGRFLRVNAALCRFFGYDEATFLTKNVNDLAGAGEDAVSPRFISLALAGIKEQFRFERRYCHASGSEIWARISARLVRDGNGKPLYFIAHVLDVTESRRNAELLTQHANALEALLQLGSMREAGFPELGQAVLSRAVALTGSRELATSATITASASTSPPLRSVRTPITFLPSISKSVTVVSQMVSAPASRAFLLNHWSKCVRMMV